MSRNELTPIWLAALLVGSLLPVPASPAQNVRPGPLFGRSDDRPQDAELTGRNFDDNRIQIPKRLLLAGRVILEDGNPLPESLSVELACGGSVQQQTYTYGEKGHFSFELGGSQQAANVSGSGSSNWDPFSRVPTERRGGQRFDLSGCVIRTALDGFQANSIPLGVRGYMDDSDVGVILLRRLEQVGGSTVSFNTLAAPKKAQKHYREADLELKKQQGDVQKAIRNLERAIELYPKFAAAWYLLGRCHHALRDRELAREHFQKAAAADPKYLRPYMYLAMMAVRDESWEEVARYCEHVIGLNSHITRAHYFGAVANLQLGRLDRALKSVTVVLESGSKRYLAGSYYVHGAILAQKKDFAGAAREFRSFIALKSGEKTSQELQQRLTSWEEQGLIRPQ
jgi:tetratricopeptide (TPR) repeat protein